MDSDHFSSPESKHRKAKSACIGSREVIQDCAFCDELITILRTEHAREHIRVDLGPVGDILSSNCPRHLPLLQRIRKWLGLAEGSSDVLGLFRDCFTSSITFSCAGSYKVSPPLDLMHRSEEQGFSGHGIKLEPSWIETATLTQWYTACLSEHGQKCSKPAYLQYLPEPGVRILIDVEDNCLTPAPDNPCYLALSYVWGKVDMITTSTMMFSHLREPNALLNEALPRTIKNAMHLTRLLGERFLWVDGLCILQDDSTFLQDQLGRMASIFAHAEAVIIPIDGTNADSGIPGLKGTEAGIARNLDQDIILFGDMRLLVRTAMGRHRDYEAVPLEKDYFNRGWTFQEYLFARRRICFQNNSAWFQCCSSIRYEDHGHPEVSSDERDFLLNVGYPSLTIYARLLEDFNQRQLSFPQDCLPAMAGMFSCYSKAFSGGFLSGLPELFFDVALLWQPAADLVRRKSVETSKSHETHGHNPAWSWAGWQGKIDFRGWATGNDFVAACSGWIASTRQQTIPTVDWYTTTDSSGKTGKRKIRVEWAAWRDRYKDSRRDIPAGWTRSERREDETLTIETHPEGFGKFLYSHPSCNASFWYPLPLSDPNYSYQPRTQGVFDPTYLLGSVETAKLFVSGGEWEMSPEPEPFNQDGSTAAYVSLYTSQEHWAGALCLHSRDYFKARRLNPERSPVEVQLIAISRGFIPNGIPDEAFDFAEYNRAERPKDGGKYEFFNVMWISWKEGVAYREGLGRVEKGRWESLQASKIDVVLG